MTIENILAAQGFEPEHTGGGCWLLSKYLPNGTFIWVSDQEGSAVPVWNDWMVCVYPADYWAVEDSPILFDAYSGDHGCSLLDAVAAALDSASAAGSATV